MWEYTRGPESFTAQNTVTASGLYVEFCIGKSLGKDLSQFSILDDTTVRALSLYNAKEV